jgi:phage baseplate assembly protein W
MAREYLGRGFRFPVVPDATGALDYSDGDENVEHSLRVLLLTRVGERLMRAPFGSRLGESVFQAGSDQNLRTIEREVRAAIVRYETRVEVLDVRAEAEADEPSHVTVALSYQVRRTSSRESLVFPFYLMRGAKP